ncbi:MAG: hypothetical protein COC05_06930 [Gammaproteobacteria bacterium]|nr:MAG: hypothetical protein COC05_06930 [Gammaproteobacteria bacterium]
MAATAQAPTEQKNELDQDALAEKCQPADIIVTRDTGLASGGIAMGSCSSYSHAILSVGDGMCVESMPVEGVTPKPLKEALRKCTYAVLFRHRTIGSQEALWVSKIAKEFARAQIPFDQLGAARSGAQTGCAYEPGRMLFVVSIMIEVVDNLLKNSQADHDASFFCSELVARAFEQGYVPLLDVPAHAINPGSLVRSQYLQQIEVLVNREQS